MVQPAVHTTHKMRYQRLHLLLKILDHARMDAVWSGKSIGVDFSNACSCKRQKSAAGRTEPLASKVGHAFRVGLQEAWLFALMKRQPVGNCYRRASRGNPGGNLKPQQEKTSTRNEACHVIQVSIGDVFSPKCPIHLVNEHLHDVRR